MSLLTVVLISMSAAFDVWTESSLVNVLSDAEPGIDSDDGVRLYGARGEVEAFQICLRPGKSGVENLRIEGGDVPGKVPAPELFLVEYVQPSELSIRATSPVPLVPDALRPFETLSLPAELTRSVWVRYTFPRDMEPGIYETSLRVRISRFRGFEVPVTLEVFDWALPEEPALRGLFSLDRRSMSQLYGLDAQALLVWKPIYDALSHHRISYSVWDGGPLVPFSADGGGDARHFQEHLRYAVAAACMNTIDLGAGDLGTAPFAAPPPGVIADSLEDYLLDMDVWLQKQGWFDRCLARVMPPPPRDQWVSARAAYFRVHRLNNRLPRIFDGPLHPYFERYTDIWAIPLTDYDPQAQESLKKGESLTREPAFPYQSVAASSSAPSALPAAYAESPVDACDGSLFSAWRSEGFPREQAPEWIEIQLEDMVNASGCRVTWINGLEPAAIRVRTSANGRVFTDATTEWTHQPAFHRFAESVSIGEFKVKKPMRAIRLEFSGTVHGGAVGIRELSLLPAVEQPAVSTISPVKLWLRHYEQAFPSLALGAAPAEPRLVAWTCWGYRFDGYLAGTLNTWPQAWQNRAADDTSPWLVAGTGADTLFYPGPDGPLPSVRLERLRDGMEDYDYLRLGEQAMNKGRVDAGTMDPLLVRPTYPAGLAPRELADEAAFVLKNRVELGRALAGQIIE